MIVDFQGQEHEFPDNATEDQIRGALSSLGRPQGQPAASAPASQPYSLGPIGDLTELGARGINAGVQSVGRITGLNVGPPRTPAPLGQPINLPGIGQPSVIGTGGALLKGAVSGATLPGDVYTGKLDPLSDQGIQRATDLAAMTALPTVPSSVVRAPAAALATPKIKAAATTAMDAIRDEMRAVPISATELENLSKDISAHVNKYGPSAKTARAAHDEIDNIAMPSRPVEPSAALPETGGRMSAAEYRNSLTADTSLKGDLGDLVDSRSALMDIVRTSKGHDVKAAKMAVDQIDGRLEGFAPGVVKKIREADKNYAIALAVGKQEKGITKAIAQGQDAGTGGNVGNKIRQAVEKDLQKGLEKDRLSPEVQAAMENVTKPGWAVNALRPLAGFDPTHSKLGAIFSGMGSVAAAPGTGGLSLMAPAGGYAARAMYDRIMRERAAKISNVMRAQAPAAIANPGVPGGIFAGRQAPALGQPGILNLGIKPGDSGYRY